MLAAVSFAGAQNVTDLIISEIMAEPDSSQTSIVDDYGQKNGWIEIFNTSQGTVNYGGCYLTDDRSAIPAKGKTKFMPADHPLYKYLIPKGDLRTQLGPRQTVIFYASGEGSQGTFYTDFKIRRDSWIYLVSNDKCTISLYQMQSKDGLSADAEEGQNGKDFWGKATFVPVSVKSTIPNTPYMVKVDQASADDELSFEVQQYGSDVDATVVTDAEEGNYMNTADYTFTGETGMGRIGNDSHTFTHYGSYSGKRLHKNGGWFYFAQGKFYNSKNLSAKYEYVNVFPFRAYFAHKTSSSSAKAMDGFTVSFDDNWTTGISDVNSFVGSALTLTAGRGTLTMTADSDQKATVVSASGLQAWKGVLSAGQSVTVSLPAGIYIVNGKKVIIY